jgi:hypothetical protein
VTTFASRLCRHGGTLCLLSHIVSRVVGGHTLSSDGDNVHSCSSGVSLIADLRPRGWSYEMLAASPMIVFEEFGRLLCSIKTCELKPFRELIVQSPIDSFEMKVDC